MSFFSYKPSVRQEGFHLPAPHTMDLFQNHYQQDAFRKFPSAASAMDFDDELASLIGQSNERSTQSPPNLFDSSHSHPSPMLSEFTPPHTHFAPVRYNPNDSPHHHHHPSDPPPPPPSSYHFNRHTPSPIHQQPPHPQSRSRSRSRPPSGGSTGATAPTNGSVGPARTTRSRRNNSVSSTSSPPPPHARPQAIVIPRSASNNNNGGGGGSAISPLSASGGGAGGGGSWFIPSHSTSDYSLSESLGSHSHHSHSHSQSVHHPAHNTHQGYTPFSLPSSSNNHTTANGSSSSVNGGPPSSDMHIPPVSALHSSIPKTDQHHFSASPPGSYGLNGINGLSGININGLGGLGNLNVNVPNGLGSSGSPVSPSSAGLNSPLGLPAPTLNGGLNGGLNAAAAAITAQEKQAFIANEKRRRRRESHNAVERRRRDNINEKITELATLIPECMLEAGSNPNGSGGNGSLPNLLDDGALPSPDGLGKKEDSDVGENGVSNSGAGGVGVVKANKGMILRKSVEYIRYLQQLVTAQGTRNRELEAELKAYRAAAGILPSVDGERKDTDSHSAQGSIGPSGSAGSDAAQSRNASSSPTSPGSDGSDMQGMVLHDDMSKHPHMNGHAHGYSGNPHGHGHGHGHVRGTSSNGFGSFGSMFGLPSMPEGHSEEGGEADDDLRYPDVDMNGMNGTAVMMEETIDRMERMERMERETMVRGRTRVKSQGHGNVGKIKEEQDLIAMEA